MLPIILNMWVVKLKVKTSNQKLHLLLVYVCVCWMMRRHKSVIISRGRTLCVRVRLSGDCKVVVNKYMTPERDL